MTNNSTTSPTLQSEAETAAHLLDDWFDPIETGRRDRVCEFIQAMIESELEAALVRPCYGRRSKADAKKGNGPSGISGHRHGHRSRSVMGTFGRVEIAVPRARLDTAEGKAAEWKSKGCELISGDPRRIASAVRRSFAPSASLGALRRS